MKLSDSKSCGIMLPSYNTVKLLLYVTSDDVLTTFFNLPLNLFL